MKQWEIAKAMSEGKYDNGQRFVSDRGTMIIREDVLVWEKYLEDACIVIGNSTDWEELE